MRFFLKKSKCLLKYVLFFSFILCLSKITEAKDFTISSSVLFKDSVFYLTINNNSADTLPIKELAARFAGKNLYLDTSLLIPAKAANTIQLPFLAPDYAGSYNLSIRITYLNDGIPLSVVSNSLFNFGWAGPVHTTLTLKATHIKKYGKIFVEFQDTAYMKYITPILPSELLIKSVKRDGNKLVYEIENRTPQFHNNYFAYWIVEKTTELNGVKHHLAAAFPIQISTGGGSYTILNWNFPSFPLLTALWIISLLLLVIFSLRRSITESFKRSLCYLLFYFFLINAVISVFQIPNLITGFDYDYFRDMVLPFYYAGLLGYGAISAFQLFRADEKERGPMLANKKIWIIFSFIYNNLHKKGEKKTKKGLLVPFDAKVKTAFSSVVVKFFFLPLLSSWAINNIFHVADLIRDFKLNFYYVNGMLIDTFILFDTSIFAFSYAVESKRLKSTIRSVEPTIIGWIVCLWCYPPFNHFSFNWLANLLPYKSGIKLPGWALMSILATIAFLWLIYVSATFALGLKASNLTNRGIVSRFPYNLIRHPAYASKNLLWILAFLFLSTATIPYGKYDILCLGQVIGFVVIYYLRAITEEKHLSKDPDYINYRQKVRYRFIPGIW